MLRRILFVDDDTNILDGMRKTLRRRREQWDMVFASGGAAAIEELDRASFDVVVTDMRMPDVDGVAVLEHARRRDPTTVRMVLSGFADSNAVLRVLPVAHQLFTKPINSRELSASIDRVCELRERFASPRLRAVIADLDRLPAGPATFAELEAYGCGPEPQLRRVAQATERDPALALRILQLASSAFFAHDDESVVAIDQAVACVGLDTLERLVTSSHALLASGEVASGFDLEQFQRHSFEVATRAREFARDAPTEAYIAGLLHDIGGLVIATAMRDEHLAIDRYQREHGCARSVAERAVLGATNADMGSYLLGLWGFPQAIVEAVARQGDPTLAIDSIGAAIRSAHISHSPRESCEVSSGSPCSCSA